MSADPFLDAAGELVADLQFAAAEREGRVIRHEPESMRYTDANGDEHDVDVAELENDLVDLLIDRIAGAVASGAIDLDELADDE